MSKHVVEDLSAVAVDVIQHRLYYQKKAAMQEQLDMLYIGTDSKCIDFLKGQASRVSIVAGENCNQSFDHESSPVCKVVYADFYNTDPFIYGMCHFALCTSLTLDKSKRYYTDFVQNLFETLYRDGSAVLWLCLEGLFSNLHLNSLYTAFTRKGFITHLYTSQKDVTHAFIVVINPVPDYYD